MHFVLSHLFSNVYHNEYAKLSFRPDIFSGEFALSSFSRKLLVKATSVSVKGLRRIVARKLFYFL